MHLNQKFVDDETEFRKLEKAIIKDIVNGDNVEVKKTAKVKKEDSPAEARKKMMKKSYREDRDEDDEREVKAKRISKRDQMNALLKDGNKACASRGEFMYEGVELADCFATAFVESLNNEDLRIDPIVAIQYYHENIEPDLAAGLAKYSSLSTRGNEDYLLAKNAIKALKADLPGNQKELYEQIVFTSAKALEKVSLEVRMLRSNPNMADIAAARTWDMNSFNTMNLYEIQSAQSRSNLNPIEYAKVFRNGYLLPSQAIMLPLSGGSNGQNLNGDPRLRNIPGVVPAPGNGRSNLNSRTGQIQDNNTYQGIQAPNSFGLDELAIPGTIPQNQTQATYQNGMIVAPTADQVLNGTGQQAIIVLPAGTSNGVDFGQPRSLSPQTEQAQINMRAQQAQRIWVQQ
ncbi:hypothetical protein D3C87_1318610 [compost metagenome]